MIIDSANNAMGEGQNVEDMFNKTRNCLDFRLNHPTMPDCFIGYTNRDISEGEQLCASLGKEYWLPRHRIQTLGPLMTAACMKHYKFTERDIRD